MKKLTEALTQKIQGWLKPLPENLQSSVWEALSVTEKAGVHFNERATNFSELFFWHLTPPGSFYWECIHKVTEFFQKQRKEKERGDHVRRFTPGWRPTAPLLQQHAVA